MSDDATQEAKERLHAAITAGNLAKVEALIEEDISINDPDRYGQLPMFIAAQAAGARGGEYESDSDP